MAKIIVRTEATDSSCSLHVRTTHQMQATKSSCSLHVWMAQQMRATESPCLQGCSDTKVKTADREAFPCRYPDARSTCPNMLLQNMKLLILVRMPSTRNSFLTCFSVSRAYLKGLLVSVIVRIPVENFIVLREGLLGKKVICISLRVYFVL
jgi:hypothetical protein